jgi:hypothetical protein
MARKNKVSIMQVAQTKTYICERCLRNYDTMKQARKCKHF